MVFLPPAEPDHHCRVQVQAQELWSRCPARGHKPFPAPMGIQLEKVQRALIKQTARLPLQTPSPRGLHGSRGRDAVPRGGQMEAELSASQRSQRKPASALRWFYGQEDEWERWEKVVGNTKAHPDEMPHQTSDTPGCAGTVSS